MKTLLTLGLLLFSLNPNPTHAQGSSSGGGGDFHRTAACARLYHRMHMSASEQTIFAGQLISKCGFHFNESLCISNDSQNSTLTQELVDKCVINNQQWE